MRKVTLKHEQLLVNIFYYLLSKGITKPVTEKRYFAIVNETLKRINQPWLGETYYVTEEESFEQIIAKAGALHRCTKSGIKLYKYRGAWAAFATYDLYKVPNLHELRIKWWPRQEDVFYAVINEEMCRASSRRRKLRPLSEQEQDVAKKVASLFINEIIQKYLITSIEQNRWPKQCNNVNKYIFERNIAPCIDEKGTAELFAKLYLHAIEVVGSLIRDNKGEFIISNRDTDVLAFANWLKLFSREEFNFLTNLKHDQYKRKDLYIKCTVSSGQATYISSKCIYEDPFDEDRTYSRGGGKISEIEVEIMEKRIACFQT